MISSRITRVIHPFVVVLLLGTLPAVPLVADEDKTAYVVQADGLACPFCAYGIEKQIQRIDGVESVSTDIKSGTVVITMTPGRTLEEADAQRAVEAAGFTMRRFERRNDGG